MQTDISFRLRIPNRRGMLAEVVSKPSATGVMFSDIRTRHIGRRYIYRDITVGVANGRQRTAAEAALENLPEVIVDDLIDEVLHMREGGKLVHRGRYEISTSAELREVYTPGVAKVCLAIQKDSALARRYTSSGHTVAVVSDGSRVLGLADIGPLASLPVMESKALFYGQFVDLNAVPIVIPLDSVDQFVDTVLRISPGFAGVHLEDIRTPECFEIEQRLTDLVSIPVMHDDQHGTAVVALAAMVNMLHSTGRTLEECDVAQIGLGAAGLAIATLVAQAGAQTVRGVDANPLARASAQEHGITVADFDEAIDRADLVCLATGRAGLLPPQRVSRGQIILSLSNPVPEIEPEVAIEAGAAFAADGKTVNHILCYPGLFKVAIEANVKLSTPQMKLAAARVIAANADEEEIMPDPMNRSMHMAVAHAVQLAAAGSSRGAAL